jgi:transposase
MQGDRISMSQRERDVLKVMSLVLSGKRTQMEAARLLVRSVRQVRRIERRLESQGDAAVVHRLRGRPSNRRIDASQRHRVMEVYSRDYGDFGPTLASEKLSQQGMEVARETLRRWLIHDGLWKPRRKREKHRSRRLRRMCFGELVQADGSHHDWLEGRGAWLTLLVMIDDATSKAVARFYEAETTEGYMDLLGRYCRKHGRMVSLYTDRHSIFWEEGQEGRPVQTQFTRALAQLGIEWIPAYSPQAKGRVERFNGTAQDRLVKELRLAGACTLEAANAVLEKTFLPWFNRRCTVKAASPNDAHRPLQPGLNLAAILSVQESRTVANDYTIRYHNEVYQLLPPAHPGLRGGKVIVENRLDGTRHIRFQGKYLPFKAIASAAKGPGALPPDPRSLSLLGKPAGEKGQGRTVVAARPCAVYPALGRSGRTPAEPCLPEGEPKDTPERRWRPAADHPWRRAALACLQRGHF